jgi:hypothetical protein
MTVSVSPTQREKRPPRRYSFGGLVAQPQFQ